MNSFTEKLEFLFKNVTPLGREYYNREVAELAVNSNGECIVSEAYVRKLRIGLANNPTVGVVQALANFFGVDPYYFFDDSRADHIKKQLEVLSHLQRFGVENFAMRMSSLDKEEQDLIYDLIIKLSDKNKGMEAK